MLDKKDFQNLRETISRMFPTETKESYYIPGCYKIPAKGKLYQAYKGYREKLSAAGLIDVRRKAKKRKVCDDALNQKVSDLDNVSKIEFLLSHTDPWSTVVEYWASTSAEREIICKENSLEKYIETFPCLAMTNGFELVGRHFLI